MISLGPATEELTHFFAAKEILFYINIEINLKLQNIWYSVIFYSAKS